MGRLQFNARGELVGVDKKIVEFSDGTEGKEKSILKTSESLEFLKPAEKIENIFQKDYWALYEKDKMLEPLKFSNGKTQEDVVKEICSLIEGGEKIIFLKGVCGTGKSAIALNVARALGKSSVIVPIKSLQSQYEKDYTQDKYVVKRNGEKMKIAMITGRENHDSIFEEGKSCADNFLPETIKLVEKNRQIIKKYYEQNPFAPSKQMPEIREMKRMSVAPANPYWSPILPAEIELNVLKDAKKIKYKGVNGKDFVFYHRKNGCSYYDQYLAYRDADVIIFNSAKYLSEIAMGRKPETEVDIIDEADEFLDSFSSSFEINLTRLGNSLRTIVSDNQKARDTIDRISVMIKTEETNKRALGIDKEQIHELKETKIFDMLKAILSDKELQTEISLDELNYANHFAEIAESLKDSLSNTFLNYRKEDDFIIANLTSMNLADRFRELTESSKALIFMSGTLHSDYVLKNIFGVKEFAKVDAETLNQGAIEICRTGKETDCRYSNFSSGRTSRKDYLISLRESIKKAEKPALIHVNAFRDLPSEEEKNSHNLWEVLASEQLMEIQRKDRSGKSISEFKRGETNMLFTTKCSRGIDFPGESCRSVVFTKYPNPNVQDMFWKILQKTYPSHYWEFYRDKAKREFLQRVYRAVRSKDDHVFVLSPDSRVLDAVKELQKEFN